MQFKTFRTISFLVMLLISNNLYSIGPGDIALIEVAMNTLNSVRELNQIVTEQREFNDNFERVYQKVDQGIWKADRTALWLEDMKNLKETKVENLNDFNSVLRRLKDETESVRRKLITQYNQRQETKQALDSSKNDQRKDRKRIAQYSSEIKSKLSPDAAQLETARNTKDMLVEIARLNSKIGSMNGEISKLSLVVQNQEERYLLKKIRNNKSLRKEKRGILTQSDVKK